MRTPKFQFQKIRQQYLPMLHHRLLRYVQRYWSKALLLAAIAVLLWHKDLSFQLDLNAPRAFALAPENALSQQANVHPVAFALDFFRDLLPLKTVETVQIKSLSPSSKATADTDNLANTYSNMLFPVEVAEQNVSTAVPTDQQLKRQKQEAYIQRFA